MRIINIRGQENMHHGGLKPQVGSCACCGRPTQKIDWVNIFSGAMGTGQTSRTIEEMLGLPY